MKKHIEINFSPFATNVLDCVERKDLQTPDGLLVEIYRISIDFGVKINGVKVHESDSNINVSYFLNCKQVGYLAELPE